MTYWETQNKRHTDYRSPAVTASNNASSSV
jgi:hypothetical protein